jgi:Tfp pilus assembly protein FimT
VRRALQRAPQRTLQPRARGLVLAELLVALAIGALLTVPLAALLQDAAASGASGRAALDLNADLRFALSRIGTRASAATPWPYTLQYAGNGSALVPDLSTWLQTETTIGKTTSTVTTTYALSGNPQTGASLVETQVDANGNTVATSIIASNVTAFTLSAPDMPVGQPLVKAELTLSSGGVSVSGARTFRLWGWR